MMSPAAIGPIRFAVFQHDSVLGAVILALTAAAALLAGTVSPGIREGPRRAVAIRTLQGAALVVGGLYLVDVAVYRLFVTRLYLQDVVTFSGEMKAALGTLGSVVRAALRRPVWQILAIVVGASWLIRCVVLALKRPSLTVRGAAVFGGAAVPLLAFYFLPVSPVRYYVGDIALYENVLERNAISFESARFTAEFRTRLANSIPRETCYAGAKQPLNIVVVIVESLSAYHSRFFSDLEDWTPQLDSIARAETALTGFHANGWTSIGALLALMGGELPLVPERPTSVNGGRHDSRTT